MRSTLALGLLLSLTVGPLTAWAANLPLPPAIQKGFRIGGASGESLTGIGFDASGNLYIAGNTAGGNFPVADKTTIGPFASNSGHLFVAKINLSTQEVLYVTEIGGSSQ